jgi:hypothetical protein
MRTDFAEQTAFVLGINPVDVEKGYAVADRLFKDKGRRKAMTSALGRAWFEATANKDYATLTQIRDRALQVGIDMDAVMRSAKQRMALNEKDLIERAESENMLRSIVGLD